MSAVLEDELSIDSKTDKKIQITPDKSNYNQETVSSTHSKTSTSKAHFRIDWRQLTYYKKERRSLASHFSLCNKLTNKQSQLQQQQQQPHIYWEDDELDNEETASLGDSSGRSYLEGGRLSRVGATESTSASTSVAGPAKRRPILNSLDGCFRSGELSAILGPSGAGKSTFLSALFGDKQESSYGQTKVTWFPPQAADHNQNNNTATTTATQANAEPLNTKRSIRIAILPQQDHLLNHLTVYETLMFASKIKNPHKANCKSFHRLNVKRVAKTLKLTECLQTRCGRLSGGQYKRVSIGQELLSEPDVIILDEPTSGLDAMTCLTTVRTLKSIALKHPISIILTIHQPDIDVFNLFDKVYVIAQGGLAIYEGPPSGVVPTLAQVNLFMPSDNYNPARFIVENAFVAGPELSEAADSISCVMDSHPHQLDEDGELVKQAEHNEESLDESNESDSEDDDDDDDGNGRHESKTATSFLRQSLSSITGALSGQTLKYSSNDLSKSPNGTNTATAAATATTLILGKGNDKRFRDSGRQPLLNIGIQTADGKLITSDQLTTSSRQQSRAATLTMENELRKQTLERLRNLRRLNALQKERYYNGTGTLTDGSLTFSDVLSQQTSLSINEHNHRHHHHHHQLAGSTSSTTGRPLSLDSRTLGPVSPGASSPSSSSSSSTTSSSSSWTEARDDLELAHPVASDRASVQSQDHHKLAGTTAINISGKSVAAAAKTTGANSGSGSQTTGGESVHDMRQHHNHHHLVAMAGSGDERYSATTTATRPDRRAPKLRRQFDKRLSAKRVHSKQGDHPMWYHTFLLTHRTWLSIVRDPVFFGIQFAMHTTIPILLALIFGSQQEEGCPRVGNFDLVAFAYADDRSDFLQGTMRSIRKSIGNIGVVFFEMFVLSFAINCITALVFPLDMYVLLKEHRNGWYSLKSYFFGRTLADLPVPIVLHSMAMIILCYMTGQPLSWWRFSAVIGIVILASLVAQSVGLTIGALLMRSSQSAVLAAAGIVAPFFALSGFIVRIHTLPWIAQWAAQGSYLYHLLNGFIIMRYGFGRCPCSEEDFELDESHKIPGNIKTMASMWVGTYSNEFESSQPMMNQLQQHHRQHNKTNIDPNIDIIDKLMGAFKMANSFGHKVDNCDDVLPYAMLDFNLHDSDIWHCVLSLVFMLLVSRLITFSAIYYKIRSVS
uniref:ATP-binding cassette sub-family G member 1 n=1 Tax=Aceria tosichella TaxID=561515 RepID=A0A6G1SJV2_9ACAR